MDNEPLGVRRFLIRLFSLNVGRKQAIPRVKMVAKVRDAGYDLDEREVRGVIHDLRREGHLIIGASGEGGGYFLAENKKEVDDFIAKEINSHAMDLLQTKRIMRKKAREEFGDAYQESLL